MIMILISIRVDARIYGHSLSPNIGKNIHYNISEPYFITSPDDLKEYIETHEPCRNTLRISQLSYLVWFFLQYL